MKIETRGRPIVHPAATFSVPLTKTELVGVARLAGQHGTSPERVIRGLIRKALSDASVAPA